MKSILDPSFQYAPAKSHEGSTEAFRERLKRYAKAQRQREEPVLDPPESSNRLVDKRIRLA